MNRRLAVVLVALLVVAQTYAALAGTETGHYVGGADEGIRVGLVRSFRGTKQITVLASSNYTVARGGSGEKLAACTNLEPITLDPAAGKLSLKLVNGSGVDAGASVTITADDASAMLSVDSPRKPGKQYRGALEVTLKSGCLQLVNIARIEDYLPGVLAGEMPSSYPDEALKAQAIAARSYTIRARGKHAASGYDLCDDSHCQVYDGAMREKPSSTRAVLATAGQVMTFGGRIASIMYCADCGGATECYAEAHNGAIPYMPCVVEPDGIAHSAWEKTYKIAELTAKLASAGIKGCDGLQKIAVAKTSTSGRARTFELTGSKGSVTMDGIKLRAALGRDGIRSTLCTVETSADGVVTFRGKGWGHGIGMCQVGAGALAGPPFSYTCAQILAHYYPGTVVTGSADGIEATSGEALAKPSTPRQPVTQGEGERPSTTKRPTPPQPSPTGEGAPSRKPSEAARSIDVRVDAPRL